MLRIFLAGHQDFHKPPIGNPFAPHIRHRTHKYISSLDRLEILMLIPVVTRDKSVRICLFNLFAVFNDVRLFVALNDLFSVIFKAVCLRFYQLTCGLKSICYPSGVTVFASVITSLDEIKATVRPVYLCLIHKPFPPFP